MLVRSEDAINPTTQAKSYLTYHTPVVGSIADIKIAAG